jgi:hypothetical protein
MSGRTLRYILVGALALAIGIPSVAIGFGEGRTMLLGKRNPSPSGSKALKSETEIIASNGTYGTRQSNKKDGDGGGAIYGCRSSAGAEPCIRANNLKGGRAFEFATVGKEAGRIETGDTTGAPLTTNATGVATGFNADKVDGKEAADFAAATDLKTLSDGLLSATVADGGTITNPRGAVGNATVAGNVYTIKFGRDVSKCAYTASPQGASVDETPGVSPGTDPTTVNVNMGAARAFYLQVSC